MGIDTLGYTHTRLLRQMDEVNLAWWRVWEAERLVKLIPRPSKWSGGVPDVQPGDIVVFLRDGRDAKVGATPWRVGRVRETEASADGIVRTLVIEYRNSTETVLRSTRRSVRSVAVLVREEESDVGGEFSTAAKSAAVHMILSRSRE